jgi:hypothetical protein
MYNIHLLCFLAIAETASWFNKLGAFVIPSW